MAAPEYVPTDLADAVRTGLPIPAPKRWAPDDPDELGPRPGDLGPAQPTGRRLGNQGPDQGFAIRIARTFEDRLHLQTGEHLEDVIAGVVDVALKRASVYGRAPVVHDLEIGFRIWGFLDSTPPRELVDLRRRLFEGIHHFHHAFERRDVADAVPEESLRRTPGQVSTAYDGGWRDLLDLPAIGRG